MDSVIDERSDRFSIGTDSLEDIAARVVKLWGVIVIGDFPFSFASRDFELGWLKSCRCFIDGFCHFRANRIEIFQVRCETAVAIRKAVAIRRTMSMRCANQDILRWDARDLRADFVAECGGKTEEVRADNRRARASIIENQSA